MTVIIVRQDDQFLFDTRRWRKEQNVAIKGNLKFIDILML